MQTHRASDYPGLPLRHRAGACVVSMLVLASATQARPNEPPTGPAVSALQGTPTDTGNAIADGLADVLAIERWFERMGEDASDLSVLFGIPAPADRARIEEGTQSVLTLAARATKRLEAGIAAHDRAEAANDAGGQAEPGRASEENAARAVHARTVLLPLRAARAMLLSAAIEPDTAKRARLCEAAAKAAAGAEPVSPWADAERSLVLGVAGLLRAGERAEGLREALDHLAAAKRTIAEPDAPKALELELGDDVALASVMGVHTAQPTADVVKLLERALAQPAFNAPGAAGLNARIVAAEVRVRLLWPGWRSPGRTSPPAPEEAFEGYLREYERAEREGGDPAVVLRRRIQSAGGEPRQRVISQPVWFDPGGVVMGLMHLSDLTSRDIDPVWVRESASRLDRLGIGSRWRRIFALTILDARRGLDPETHLALARFGLDVLSHLPEKADQAHALKRAREALAPLGPAADTDLAERVFTLTRERTGKEERVVAPGRTPWGLKEVHEAQAAAALRSGEYGRTRDLLDKADALTSTGVWHCAECWWHLLDALLRDPDAPTKHAAFIAEVAQKTERAVSRWVSAGGERSAAEAAALAEVERIDPELRIHRENAERTARIFGVDALLAQGKRVEAASMMGAFMQVRSAHPGASALASAAGLDIIGLASVGDSLNQMADEDRREWTARLIDRAWVSLRPAAIGFIESATIAPHTQPASVLATLSAEVERLPDAVRSVARERCAWGTLIAGAAPRAATMFRACIDASGKRIDLLRGLGESLIIAGDDAGAFGCFRDISAAAAPAGETARDHFHAWARMLEILVRQNADGSKSATIAREARRLMLLKPVESCPECARRIEAAASAAE